MVCVFACMYVCQGRTVLHLPFLVDGSNLERRRMMAFFLQMSRHRGACLLASLHACQTG